MNAQKINDFHIALGESIEGGKILAYLVEDDHFSDDIELTIEGSNIVLSSSKQTHILENVSNEIISTLRAHLQFKVINVNTDYVYDVTLK